MKYFKFVLLIIMLTTTHLQAQWNYVVDVVGGDSTALVKPMKTKGGLAKGDTISWLHNGDTVFVAEADSGFVDNSLVTITMDKQKYFVDRKDLMFGDNPSERADFVNSDSKARKSHTRLGHLYLGDTTLYWLFLGLLLAATIFAFFGSVICIPLLLAAPAIEVVGLCFLGKDMLWWIEGSWTGVLRLLLFALAVTLQIVSFYYFTQRRKSMIKGNVDVSSPLASALFGVGALLVMTLVCNFLHVKQSYAWIIKVMAVLIISVPDFIKSLRNNGGALGFFAGLMFTFFVQLSVVGMLAPSWNDTTMSDADRALFGLLYTEALHRSGLYIGSDSLIKASKEYFEQHGDDKHLARALLHHGIILYHLQNTREGILSIKQAEQMANGLHEPAFDWYLYSVLGDVNDNVGDHIMTLRYYKQALEAARQVDNKQWTVQTLNNIATTFDVLGEKDSLKYYLDQAKPLVACTEGDVRANYLVNNASYMMKTGKRDEAKHLLNESMQISPTDRGEKLLADIYVQEGDTASAVLQWYKLTTSFSPDIAIQSYHQLIEYLNKRGDVDNVAMYSQRLNEVYSSLNKSNDAAGIIDMMTQFDEQAKERRQYRTVIIMLAAIILLMIISALLVWYGRHRIDKLNARFAESQQQYNLTRTELTQMRRQKEREQRENSMQMKPTKENPPPMKMPTNWRNSLIRKTPNCVNCCRH